MNQLDKQKLVEQFLPLLIFIWNFTSQTKQPVNE